MTWSLAEAKNQLSELVRRAAQEGPQTISVRGEAAAVVISKAEYDRLVERARPRDFKEWLLNGPDLDGLDLEWDPAAAPDIEL